MGARRGAKRQGERLRGPRSRSVLGTYITVDPRFYRVIFSSALRQHGNKQNHTSCCAHKYSEIVELQ